jgi:hypothetical protein
MAAPDLERLTRAVAAVPGVAAVALGGSRARGTATSGSDTDIGLYFHLGDEPKAERVREALKGLVDDTGGVVTEVGECGPRIVGGAWLSIGDRKVDIIYRSLESAEDVIRRCRSGNVRMDYQPGHPHGFSSAIWMGEVALCLPLHDPDGKLVALKAMTEPYPEPLKEALIRLFQWEILFSIENGETAIARGDQTHIAGCAYRALCCMAQVAFALNRRYLINEKGALEEAAGFPLTLPRLVDRASNVWQAIGRRAFRGGLDELRAMERDLKALAAGDPPQ